MIFSRYLAREWAKINASLVILFISFYCLIDFLDQNTRYFPKYKATAGVIVEYYLSQIPKIIVDMLPFSVLFSTIIVLWVFSRSGEIAAMRAAGRSILKICTPLIVLGFVFSVFSFFLSEFIVPKAVRHRMRVELVKIQKVRYEEIFYDSRWIRGNDSVLHFWLLDPVHKSLNRIEYYELSGGSAIHKISYANRAVFDNASKRWVLEGVATTGVSKTGEIHATEVRAKLVTTVSHEPPRLLREEVGSDQVSYNELKELIVLSKKTGGSLADREVDLQQKLSMPFANLLFVFLALPFAIHKERQADTYFHVILCLVAAIIYWLGNASMRNLSIGGSVHPFVAAWATNIALLAVSLFVVLKLEKGN